LPAAAVELPANLLRKLIVCVSLRCHAAGGR
jgi:hypothetical protein